MKRVSHGSPFAARDISIDTYKYGSRLSSRISLSSALRSSTSRQSLIAAANEPGIGRAGFGAGRVDVNGDEGRRGDFGCCSCDSASTGGAWWRRASD